MGWSNTTAASKTLDRIEVACRATRPASETSSNVFFSRDLRYFYEVEREDQDDGGIVGIVNHDHGNGWCHEVCKFRIDGDGNIVEGPAFFRGVSS